MTKPPSPRPLSVKVIVIHFGISIPALLPALASGQSFVLGQVIVGPVAYLLNLAILIIVASITVWLWRLNELARRVAIGWLLFGALNSLLISVSPTFRQMFVESLAQGGAGNLDPSVIDSMITTMIVGINVFSIATCAVVILFLIKRKAAFGKREG